MLSDKIILNHKQADCIINKAIPDAKEKRTSGLVLNLDERLTIPSREPPTGLVDAH